MTGCENAKDIVICGGGDGVVAIFDLRSGQRVSHLKTGQCFSHGVCTADMTVADHIVRPSGDCISSP